MTCSIRHLIWSMARLTFLSASERGSPGSLGAGGDQSQPDIPFVRDVPGGRVSGRVVVRGVVVVVEEA